MGFSVHIEPGVRIPTASHRVPTLSGTRATGSPTPATMSPAQSSKQLDAARLRDALEAITTLHHATFVPAEKPLAPPPAPVDAGAIRRECTAEALSGVGLFDRAGRKAAKTKASSDAETRILREVSARRLQAFDRQAELDQSWSQLLANDPDAVLDRLATKLEDAVAQATPLSASAGEAAILVILPGEEAVPERRPTTTSVGNVSLRKMSKKDHDAFYTALVTGHTLLTVKAAFAAAPALESVRVVAVRRARKVMHGGQAAELLLAAHVRHAALASVRWTSEDAPTILSDIADELLIRQKGIAKTLTALDLTSEPDLERVIDSIDFDGTRSPAENLTIR